MSDEKKIDVKKGKEALGELQQLQKTYSEKGFIDFMDIQPHRELFRQVFGEKTYFEKVFEFQHAPAFLAWLWNDEIEYSIKGHKDKLLVDDQTIGNVAENINQLPDKKVRMYTGYLIKVFFDIYSGKKESVYIYDYRIFGGREDMYHPTEKGMERILTFEEFLGIDTYNAICEKCRENEETIENNGFFMEYVDHMIFKQPAYLCLVRDLGQFYDKIQKCINREFESETYEILLPWFPKMEIQKTEFDAECRTVQVERNQADKRARLKIECPYPYINLTCLANGTEVKKAFNNKIDHDFALMTLYKLHKSFVSDSLVSAEEFSEFQRKYAQAELDKQYDNVEAGSDEEEEILEQLGKMDAQKFDPPYINYLIAENYTCYNLIANLYCFFYLLYKQYHKGYKGEVPDMQVSDRTIQWSVEKYKKIINDMAVSIYRKPSDIKKFNEYYIHKLTERDRHFYFFASVWIKKVIDNYEDPVSRVLITEKLCQWKINKNFTPLEILELMGKSMKKILKDVNVISYREDTGRFVKAVELNHLDKIPEEFSETMHAVDIDKVSLAMVDGAVGKELDKEIRELGYSSKSSVRMLLDPPVPEEDERYAGLRNKKQGTEEYSFTRPKKENKELYRFIQYTVHYYNSFRVGTRDALTNFYRSGVLNIIEILLKNKR